MDNSHNDMTAELLFALKLDIYTPETKAVDRINQLITSENLCSLLQRKIKLLEQRNAKLDRFARLMMKTLEAVEECSDIPDHITDSVADILADWSEE